MQFVTVFGQGSPRLSGETFQAGGLSDQAPALSTGVRVTKVWVHVMHEEEEWR
jgi:hypothetical protein